MKLLIFCPYYPPHIGGLESHADEFNKYLSQRGIDIVVFTPHLPQDALETEIRHNNVKIIRFPAFEIISNYPLPKFWNLKFWQLFFSLFRKNFDIVISRTRFFNTSLLALSYAKLKKVRWIHIEHGSDFIQLSSKLKTSIAKYYDQLFGRLIFKFSDQNISISKAVQKFVHNFDKRESPVIYRGLDMDGIDSTNPYLELKEEYKNKVILVWTGRLYKWKGVENSVEAIKSLPEEIKDKIIFLIVGDGEDFAYLKKISTDEKAVALLGNLPREKAIGILKISDIYLHSAYPGGGLSTSLLEAMYCGCTIIATPNEGASEVINEKSGIIIADNSPEKIKIAIENIVLSEERRRQYALNSGENIREKFNWNYPINSYENIFKFWKNK